MGDLAQPDSARQVLSGAVSSGSKRQTPVLLNIFWVSISARDSGGEVCSPAGRAEYGNMFPLSHCAASYWEEDGGNYQRQQLREGQASAHQSALLHRHCVCVCVREHEEECVKDHLPVATLYVASYRFRAPSPP